MAQVTIRLDDALRKKADELFENVGMNLSVAVNTFFSKAVKYGGLPFDVNTKGDSQLTVLSKGDVSVVNFRVDDALKEKANELFEELGMNLSVAVNIFLRKAIKHGGLPFDVTIREDSESATLGKGDERA